MKKLLLNLTLFSSLFANAQSLHDAAFVHNFSGNINKGVVGVTTPQLLGQNVVLTTDKHGNTNSAIDITASNKYQILTGAATHMQGNNFTVSFWYKKSNTISSMGSWSHRPFFVAPNTSNSGYAEGTYLGLSPDGTKFSYGHVDNNPGSVSSKETNVSDTGITVTNWNYYSLVREGNTLKLFINGDLKDTATNVTFGNYNLQGLAYLGGYYAGSYGGYCVGSFDNFSVHKRAMSDAQALELYNYQNADTERTNVKAKFDFNPGAITTDSWGNFNAIAVNNPVLGPDRFGYPNSALSVSGTATNPQGIAIPYLNDYISDSGTIAFWYKPTSVTQTGNNHMVFLPNESRSTTGYSLNNNISARQMNSNFVLSSTTAPNGALNVNLGSMSGAWQHCAIVFNGANVKTYINGSLAGDYTIESGNNRKNGGLQLITVGHMDYAGLKSSFNGLIDELIIDKAVYTQSEIETLANNTSVAVVENPIPNYVANFSGNLNGGRKGDTPAIFGTTAVLTADKFGNTNNAIETYTNNTLVTLTNAAATTGYNDGSYTIGFWYKREASVAKSGNLSHHPFFSIPNASYYGFGEGLFLGLNPAETSFVFGYVQTTGSNGTSFSQTSPFPVGFQVNDWNYYTIEKVGNIVKLYINNIFFAQKTGITFGWHNQDNAILLGGFQNQGNSAKAPGSFDNFRLYPNVYTEAVRTQIYNWELNDVQRPTSFKVKYEFNGSLTADTNGNFPAVVENDAQLGTDRNGNANSALRIAPNLDDTKFNGIKIPYLNNYFTRNQGTIAFWYSVEGTGTAANNFNPIVTLPNQEINGGNYAIAAGLFTSGNFLNMMKAASIKSDNTVSSAAQTAIVNGWKHCAITFNGTVMTLYINGTFVDTAIIEAFPTRVNGGSQDIMIGFNNYPNAKTQFNGLIDDLIFDSSFMTNAQIASLYQTLNTHQPEQNKVVAYPNPVENNLFFSQEVDKAMVYDLFGRVILTAANTNQIDISSLAKGSYVVNFEINGTNTVQQIIKK